MPVFRQANSLAWRRQNAPSSARGMKAPNSSKRPTLTGRLFCVEAPAAHLHSHASPRPCGVWHCETLPCVSPFGPSLRYVLKRSRRFSRHARVGRPHATKTFGTFLDTFSWPRSGEPHGWGEQCSTPLVGQPRGRPAPPAYLCLCPLNRIPFSPLQK